jgi:hypothetical protein
MSKWVESHITSDSHLWAREVGGELPRLGGKYETYRERAMVVVVCHVTSDSCLRVKEISRLTLVCETAWMGWVEVTTHLRLAYTSKGGWFSV